MFKLAPYEYSILEDYFQKSSDTIFDIKENNKEIDLPDNLIDSGLLCASAFFAISCELMNAYPSDTVMGDVKEVIVSTMELQAIQEYYTNCSHFLLDMHERKVCKLEKYLGTLAVATGNILNKYWNKLGEELDG